MIRVDAAKIREIEKQLGDLKNKAPMVLARSLNRSAENARTNVVKKVKDKYIIKSRDIRETIRITKAKADQKNPTALIKSRGTRRPLIKFKVNPSVPKPKNPPNILRVAVKKNEGLKPLLNAFVARGISTGNLAVLQRQGRSRYPIFQKYGPSVPEMANTSDIRVYLESEAKKTIEKRLDHEIQRILRGNK